MTIYRARGEIVGHTETIRLRAQFRDANGDLANLDSVPNITIEEPNGNVMLGPTSVGVYLLSVGCYGYDFYIGYNYSFGVWSDSWDGILNGFRVSGSFNFVVYNTQLPMINTDGYIALGDDPGFHYSQNAIQNINLLLKTLRARLDSRGKVKSTDANGNPIYLTCDIFSVDSMVSFLALAISWFNQIPFYTFFTFEDTEVIAQFHTILVECAVVFALASKMLLERGREFQITDNSLSFTPPTVSELMQTEWSTLLTNLTEQVKMIKNSMRPSPLGIGTFSISTARHPAIARLRRLKHGRSYSRIKDF